jgi:hypothetical protein
LSGHWLLGLVGFCHRRHRGDSIQLAAKQAARLTRLASAATMRGMIKRYSIAAVTLLGLVFVVVDIFGGRILE